MFISRLHVSNFGHLGATFRDFTFDFTDGGKITHAPSVLFDIENRTGKTTMLSFILSCFVPRRDRWLQQVRGKRASSGMEQYFNSKGVPGLIVMEWKKEKIQGTLLNGALFERLVMGQMVAFDGSEIKRRQFFGFVPGNGFDFDYMAQPIFSLDDFDEKMNAIRKEKCLGLMYPPTEAKWRDMLADFDLDASFMDMQLEFNRLEGGMGEFVKTLCTDEALLKWLGAYAVPKAHIDNAQQMISDLAVKSANLPEMERKTRLLENFRNILEEFGVSAAVCIEREKSLAFSIGEMVWLREKLTGKSDQLRSRIQELDAKRASLTSEKNGLPALIREKESLFNALVWLELSREWATLEAEEKRLGLSLHMGETALREMEAAKILLELRKARKDVEITQAAASDMTRAIEPFRERASLAAASYEFSLAYRLAARKKEMEGIDASMCVAKDEIRDIEARLRCQFEEKGKLKRDIEKILAFIEECEKKRSRLADIITGAGYEPETALAGRPDVVASWKDAKSQELARLEKEKADVAEEKKQCLEEKADLERRKAVLTVEYENSRKWLEGFEADRKSLVANIRIQEIAESNSKDMLNNGLLCELDAAIRTCERKKLGLEIGRHNADMEERTIQASGLRTSPDIMVAIAALEEKGISVYPASLSLASLPLEEATEMAVNNPWLFSSLEIDGDCGAEMMRLPGISSPIVIRKRNECNSHFHASVILPVDDACWNKDSAHNALMAIEAKKDILEGEINALTGREASLRNARASLRAWMEKSSLEHEIRNRFDDAAKDIASADVEIVKLSESIEAADAGLMRSDEAIAMATSTIRNLEVIHERLIDLADIEKLYNKDVLAKHEKALQTLAGDIENLEKKKDSLDLFIREKRLERDKVSSSHDMYKFQRKNFHDLAHKLNIEISQSEHEKEPVEIGIAKEEWENTFDGYDKKLAGIEAEQSNIAKAKAILAQVEKRFDECGVPEEVAATHCHLPDINDALAKRRLENEQIMGNYREAGFETRKSADKLKEHEAKAGKPVIAPEMNALDDVGLAREKHRVQGVRDKLCLRVKEMEEEITTLSREKMAAEKEAAAIASMLDKLETGIRYGKQRTSLSIVCADDDSMDSNPDQILAKAENQGLELAAARDKLAEKHTVVKNAVMSDSYFREEFPAFVRDAVSSPASRLAESLDWPLESCSSQIESYKAQINSFKPQFSLVAHDLFQLAKALHSLLRKAGNVEVPKDVHEIGGKRILLMNKKATGMELLEKDAENILRRETGKHAASISAMDMAIELVKRIFTGGRLNFKILTMDPNSSLQHRDIATFASSGSQGVLSALLLYALNKSFQSLKSFVMPLFLDGPFNQSNSVDMVDAQMKLMRTFKIQPVFFAANPHNEIMDRFNCIIGMTKGEIARDRNGKETTFISQSAPVLYNYSVLEEQ